MDQNPQPFKAYILGAAVLAAFVVHQGLVNLLPVYQVLRLANIQAPLEPDCLFQTYCNFELPILRKEKTTIFRCGLKQL